MRDPEARLQLTGEQAIRTLKRGVIAHPFLQSALAEHWQQAGLIVPFEITSDDRLTSKRAPFVSYPSEWCDDQLYDAGALMLRLHDEAIESDFDLKDASAWNVIFDGTCPRLCDHTSVVPLNSRRWWAAGQYARHFLLPLLAARQSGLGGAQIFKAWRDGMPTEVARRLFGMRRFLTRYWPLMAPSLGPTVATPANESFGLEEARLFRRRLSTSLHWMLAGVRPRITGAAQGWRDYQSQRTHYAGDSMARKRVQVDTWIRVAAPAWVMDLGCNTGEFSEIALATGARVIAIDSDHGAVQAMYRRCTGQSSVHPVLVDLDDLQGGRGWGGGEFHSMLARLSGSADLVLMLALVHHLAIGLSIPMKDVALLARELTRDWIIIELIDIADVQLQSLCAQRQRAPEEFQISAQLSAFESVGFHCEAHCDLSPAPRHLYLMRWKS